jgi:outer membrane lipopolysaccharide assembly protein LptE/RlpB
MLWFKRRVSFVLGLLLVAILLASCGFRLQGAGGFPESMAKTYVDAGDRYTPFYRKLRVELEQGGIVLVSSPLDADAVIRIERDDPGQKVLTITGRNVPSEYSADYDITYSVWIDGVQVRPSHTLRSAQDFSYDSTEILGKAREYEQLQDSLADRLVGQVSRELSSIK